MTDPMTLAAATVIVIGAIAAATVKVVTAIGDAKKELLLITMQTSVKAEEIHELVDGSATDAARKLANVESQLVALRIELAHVQEQRVEDAKHKGGGA